MSLSDTKKILINSQKGGVGKTSIVTGVAAVLAGAGARVLVVDCDQQGNLTESDLGVESDHGRNLAMVLQFGGVDLTPVRARENLDVIPGGAYLGHVQAALAGNQSGGSEAAAHLTEALSKLNAPSVTENAEAIPEYDFILFDAGPGDTVIVDALLACVDWLIIPTKDDSASYKGVQLIARRFINAQKAGSKIDLLGVVLFDVNHRATARNAATLDQLTELFGPSEDGTTRAVFETVIRSAPGAAKDLRERHLAPQELVPFSAEVRAKTFAALKNKETLPSRLWSRDGIPLATDYQDLTREVLRRIHDAEAEALPTDNTATVEV